MLLMALMLLPVAKAQDGGERLTVTGTVINGADGNPLPFCYVHLMQDGRSRAMAVTDYAGNYTLPPIAAGTYSVLVLQFGDTLMHYKGLNIERDTWVRSVVLPPSDDSNNDALPQYVDGKIKYLRPVLIYSHRHSLLAKMGMLITDPGDPRLWNFSGRMDPFFEDRDISFWYSRYKMFYKLKAMGYKISSPFELVYPEIYHTASDSSAADYKIWIMGIKL